jgi:hypothetical protein
LKLSHCVNCLDKNLVKGRWVYAVKLDLSGEYTGDEKYKARFVAKGYSQIPNIDFYETFSPTVHMTSIRILMHIAAQENLMIHQMDVKTAFLNAPIDCELYVEQPQGFEVLGPNNEKLVCKLNKSLYGLKQSGRNWNNLVNECLIQEGFTNSMSDSCVYVKGEGKTKIFLLLWVDDILVAVKACPRLKSFFFTRGRVMGARQKKARRKCVHNSGVFT